MFYNVLMEKKARKEKRKDATPNRAQDAVKGVGIGLAGAGSLGLLGASRHAKSKAVKSNREDLAQLIGQMGGVKCRVGRLGTELPTPTIY